MHTSTVQRCNDLGIAHYRCGEIEQAISSFIAALRQTKEEITLSTTTSSSSTCSLDKRRESEFQVHDGREDEGERNESGCATCEIDDLRSLGHDDLLDCRWTKPKSKRTSNMDQESTTNLEDELFVFKRPFAITNDMSPDHVSETTMRIMFNIALSYHRLGYQSGDTRSNLEKAVKMYSLGYNILSGDDVGCSIMLVAMTNNLGHVHHLLGNHDKASCYFQQLLMALMYINFGSHRHHQSFLHQFDKRLRDQLLSNVLPLILTAQAMAPVA